MFRPNKEGIINVHNGINIIKSEQKSLKFKQKHYQNRRDDSCTLITFLFRPKKY
jgi:hypothetical protein